MLTRREVATEECGEKLLAQSGVDQVLDVAGAGPRHALTERRRARIVALDRSIEGNLDRGHQAGLADGLDGLG